MVTQPGWSDVDRLRQGIMLAIGLASAAFVVAVVALVYAVR